MVLCRIAILYISMPIFRFRKNIKEKNEVAACN